jgi:fructose-bisphosphate aldolase class II
VPLVPMSPVLKQAISKGYAVGAFNVVNLEFLEAIVEAAEEKSSPVILNIAEVHFTYIRLDTICAAIQAIANQTSVPVVLNLDHGLTREAVFLALRHGFTSVMFDGSRLDYESNRKTTKEVVTICHSLGVSVEGELGAVGGDEHGGLEADASPDLFTNVEQAGDFVVYTGIDALAVAIGNVHGKYKGEPRLDFERLKAIHKATDIPLVLHGGSGIPASDFKKAIRLGIAKINYYTGMSQAALAAATEFLQNAGKSYHDYPEMMKQIKQSIKSIVMQQMDIFLST